MRILTVLRTGGDYGPRHVEKLAANIREHEPDADVWCLTDVPDAVDVHTIPLAHDWPGWWSKIELFRPDVPGGLYLDLDSFVTGPLASLAGDEFTALEDFYHPGRLASGLMWLPDGFGAHIYEHFAASPQRYMRQFSPANGMPWGDQGYIASMVDSPKLIGPAEGVVSWKVHGLRDGARVVCCHGEPRIHHIYRGEGAEQ